jgi:hypothetical protein
MASAEAAAHSKRVVHTERRLLYTLAADQVMLMWFRDRVPLFRPVLPTISADCLPVLRVAMRTAYQRVSHKRHHHVFAAILAVLAVKNKQRGTLAASQGALRGNRTPACTL